MTDPVTDTLAWYDQHASAFDTQTADVDLGHLYDRFLRHVRPGGRILDAGCGVGRDTIAFVDRGYEVIAFDASNEMVRRARNYVGSRATVHFMRFEDLVWRAEFDGIWACASLLHIPSADFTEVMSRLSTALRPGGYIYMSFKLGEGERIKDGRFFADHTEATLQRALKPLPLELDEIWLSNDARPGRQGERWLNAIALAHF